MVKPYPTWLYRCDWRQFVLILCQTSLHLAGLDAVCTNRSEVIYLMLEHSQREGSKISHGIDHLGKSFLHHHVESMLCSTKIIRVLLEYGCIPNETNADGNSVLGLYLRLFHFTIHADIC